MAAGLVGPVAADSGLSPEESRRWDPPSQTLTITDDPAAPYIAYFTPPYRAAGSVDLAWSMMATRWRETGEVQLSVGVRIVHDGAEPWRIVGWRIADTRFPRRAHAPDSATAPIAALNPLKTCGDHGCRTYEAATFALPLAALRLERSAALDIAILTQAGHGPSIRFPAAILANLHRVLGTQQTTRLTNP
jgi:hypothetical protein